MQRSPYSSNLKLGWKTLLKVVLFVIFIGIVYYIANLYFDAFIALALVFLILLNTYWYYRQRIKDEVNKRVINRNQLSQEKNIEEPTQNEIFESFEKNYKKCPECSAEIISTLTYCEECGTEVK